MAGNLIQVTDANNHTTSYQYDAINRRIRTTVPDGTYSTLEYDLVGNMIRRMDAKGQTADFFYVP